MEGIRGIRAWRWYVSWGKRYNDYILIAYAQAVLHRGTQLFLPCRVSHVSCPYCLGFYHDLCWVPGCVSTVLYLLTMYAEWRQHVVGHYLTMWANRIPVRQLTYDWDLAPQHSMVVSCSATFGPDSTFRGCWRGRWRPRTWIVRTTIVFQVNTHTFLWAEYSQGWFKHWKTSKFLFLLLCLGCNSSAWAFKISFQREPYDYITK